MIRVYFVEHCKEGFALFSRILSGYDNDQIITSMVFDGFMRNNSVSYLGNISSGYWNVNGPVHIAVEQK